MTVIIGIKLELTCMPRFKYPIDLWESQAPQKFPGSPRVEYSQVSGSNYNLAHFTHSRNLPECVRIRKITEVALIYSNF